MARNCRRSRLIYRGQFGSVKKEEIAARIVGATISSFTLSFTGPRCNHRTIIIVILPQQRWNEVEFVQQTHATREFGYTDIQYTVCTVLYCSTVASNEIAPREATL